MSLATWKKKFYPIPATKSPKKNAASHSLKKWLGLREAALRRHGLNRDWGGVIDKKGNGLAIAGCSCALCHWYFDTTSSGDPCCSCPLYKVLGRSCGHGPKGGEYSIWGYTGDPKPMIAALRKAVRLEAKNAKV